MDRYFLWIVKQMCGFKYGVAVFMCLFFLPVLAEEPKGLMPAPSEIISPDSSPDHAPDEVNTPEQAQVVQTPEVLVFIDVSGSMKLNDPNNIRAPALRMLAGMAPTTASVGIYTFGTSVSELVAPEMVNDVWRNSAEAATHTIRSRDMYTNIEAALETANRFWFDKDYDNPEVASGLRHIILLTDGIVDIDQDVTVSEASRQRILSHTVTDLIKHKVAIHTIALSENADHDLLKQLSLQTEGDAEQVFAAEGLQRLFLKLFEQSAPQDTIPLNENRFTVDSSISEITLLLFSQKGKTTTLFSPDDNEYTKETHPEFITWQKDIGFELITIKAPAAGEWLLDANLDPDNRAMIVTDLTLQADMLPAHILNGETLDWTIWLEESGELITRTDFLSLINASVSFELANGEQRQWKLAKADEHGLLTHQFSSEWPEGKFDIVLNIDGKTFQRQRRLSITAHQSPITFEISPIFDTEQQEESTHPIAWELIFHTYSELINLAASTLTITATSQTGVEEVLNYDFMLDEEQHPVGWQASILAKEVGQYTLAIAFNGITHSGREIAMQLPVQQLGEKVEISEVSKTSAIPTLMEIIIPVGIGNVLIFLLMGLVFMFRRMQAEQMIYPEETL